MPGSLTRVRDVDRFLIVVVLLVSVPMSARAQHVGPSRGQPTEGPSTTAFSDTAESSCLGFAVEDWHRGPGSICLRVVFEQLRNALRLRFPTGAGQVAD
jgi:hypothetical protein